MKAYKAAEKAYNDNPTPTNEAIAILEQVRLTKKFHAPHRTTKELYTAYRDKVLLMVSGVDGYDKEKQIIAEALK